MGLFDLFGGKKKQQSCSCGGCCNATNNDTDAPILILGSGCKNCQTLEQNTKQALTQMGENLAVGHVTDFAEIAKYGVMTTPALVWNGKVISSGKVLKVDEIISLMQKQK